jgi:manganese/iron transport system permease protein
MLIAPGAIAFLLTQRFEAMLVIAAASAIGTSIAGTLISFHIDAATGPTIVVLQAALFILALIAYALRQHGTGATVDPVGDARVPVGAHTP